MHKPDLAIVLVRPQLGENIGACARAMFNFGFDDLRIVSPRDGWPNPKAVANAAHADCVIENAKIFDTVNDALADREFIYATSARQRILKKEVISSKKLQVVPSRSAVIFGPENNGLRNEEASLAHQLITIPVNLKCPSMNIASSVAIICYQLSHCQIIDKQSLELATHDELSIFLEKLEHDLSESGFFFIETKKQMMLQNIRTIFTRIDHLSSQDVRTLHAILRALKKNVI